MRKTFVNTILKMARTDKNIFLLTGDLGFSILENFRDEFPDRFFDVGVAEADMIGIAAGLALSGRTVFVYSIIPFAVMRCFEQIRNDVCMQNLNVKIIGVGAGLSYGSAGPTHHSICDMSIMRSLPNMAVISPDSTSETEYAVRASVENQGPVYIRLGKGAAYKNVELTENFSIGKGIVLKEGTDITVISTGDIMERAGNVVENLEGKGFSVGFVNMHTIKPIDKELIIESAKKTKLIFTIEEHSIIGGLGSAVAEVLSESSYKVIFKRFGLKDSFVKLVGGRNYLLDKNGLSVKEITANIISLVRGTFDA